MDVLSLVMENQCADAAMNGRQKGDPTCTYEENMASL
jgi:hypothetical protein